MAADRATPGKAPDPDLEGMRHRPEPDAKQLAARIAMAIGPWFGGAQRDLSWRRTRDPYAIWVSEIMLQQTRVETVERYFTRFVARFPDVDTLAAADEQDVVEAWSGLGYYRRARLLHRGARHVRGLLSGELPPDADALRAIPGIGRYTAGAIASIAFDRPEPLVDGNIARVFSRVRALEQAKQQRPEAPEHWTLARAVLEHGTPRVLAQALMELGATVCTPRKPVCQQCPLKRICLARARGLTEIIPAPRKKAASPTQAWIAAAVFWRGRLLLVRRPDQGLLAGMWCLPLHALSASPPHSALEDISRVLSKWLGTTLQPAGGMLPVLEHVFTHRIWKLHPLRLRASKQARPPSGEYQEIAWVRPKQRPSGGIPSVTQKLLRIIET